MRKALPVPVTIIEAIKLERKTFLLGLLSWAGISSELRLSELKVMTNWLLLLMFLEVVVELRLNTY